MTDFAKTVVEARAANETPSTEQDWSMFVGLEGIDEIEAVAQESGVFEERTFRQVTEYDALGRKKRVSTPQGSSAHLYSYSPDGMVTQVQRESEGKPAKTVYRVEEFDDFGRPVRVSHGGAATCRYRYDATTHRLMGLKTTAGTGKTLQDLQYTYDPVGNITEVADKAQKVVHFANAPVHAVNTYRYDALYRLVEATGREHESQAGGRAHKQAVVRRTPAPNDPNRMRAYTQRYVYDAVGNMLQLRHIADGGSFTRHYQYSDFGNRLRATGRFDDFAGRYEHDKAGNMVAMPHVNRMVWNRLNQLERVERGTQTVYFQYVGGKRIRKFVEKGGGIVEQRIYLGNEEVFERRLGIGFRKVVEQTLTEHVGGSLRVETKTIKSGKEVGKPVALFRHQLGDHQGSTAVEVDEGGRVISYEEYHPYGTSAYRATNSEIEVSANRYRFTGMERDDETGLALHGARYYAPWLGRWTASDPLGLADGVNRYAYCRGSPVTLIDPSGTTGERPVTVHSNRRARLESEAYDIERDAARLDAAERENRAALRAELGPEGLANQERDHAVVDALLATASGISYGKRQIAARRAELAKDQAQLEEDEAIQARFRTTGKVVKGATIGTAVLVGAITFAGYFGMQGVIGAAKALLEADAAASGLPLTVAVVGGTTAKATGLVDDAAGVVDDAMGLLDDAGGLVDDAAGLADDAGAAVKSSSGRRAPRRRGGGAVTLDASEVLFSQSNVRRTLPELVQSMKSGGWRGAPIDVVRLEGGQLVAVDNTRLLAAQLSGNACAGRRSLGSGGVPCCARGG